MGQTVLHVSSFTEEKYKNLGQNCWYDCGATQGPCTWCGTEGMCCRQGFIGNGCDGQMGEVIMHACVGNEGKVIKVEWKYFDIDI